MERVASQQKLLMEQKFLREGHTFAAMRAAAHFSVESALSERCNGVSYYHYLCELLEKADWTALGKKMEELWRSVLEKERPDRQPPRQRRGAGYPEKASAGQCLRGRKAR